MIADSEVEHNAEIFWPASKHGCRLVWTAACYNTSRIRPGRLPGPLRNACFSRLPTCVSIVSYDVTANGEIRLEPWSATSSLTTSCCVQSTLSSHQAGEGSLYTVTRDDDGSATESKTCKGCTPLLEQMQIFWFCFFLLDQKMQIYCFCRSVVFAFLIGSACKCISIVFVFLILFSFFFFFFFVPATSPLTRSLKTGSESNQTWQYGRSPWELATEYFWWWSALINLIN